MVVSDFKLSILYNYSIRKDLKSPVFKNFIPEYGH